MNIPSPHYRGWAIHQGRWPEPAWIAIAPDYDVDASGENGEWQASGGHVDAATYPDLIDEIDEYIDLHPHLDDRSFLERNLARIWLLTGLAIFIIVWGVILWP